MTDREAPYPHLAPALQTLTGDARDLWGDAEARHHALVAVVAAWERGDEAALAVALHRVDDAVVAGLRALGLPRGPVGAVRFEAAGRGWQGRKLASCDLVFDAQAFWQSLRTNPRMADDAFRTWVHESIHARQPFAPLHRSEGSRSAGYEEGLAEGLARLATKTWAGMVIIEQSYNGYVAAYEMLAEILNVPVERLWRRLWTARPGAVRSHFLEVADEEWLPTTGLSLTRRQRLWFMSCGDNLFATLRAGELRIDRVSLRRAWERCLNND